MGLCLKLVGAADGSVAAGASRAWYLSLNHPPGTPPNWVFAAVWTGLYAMIGVSGWLAWRRSVGTRPLRLWGWQLAANACWTPAFLGLRSPSLALAVCLVLLSADCGDRCVPSCHCGGQRHGCWRRIWDGQFTLTYLTAGFWWLNPT